MPDSNINWEALHERHIKPLESQHKGKFAAVGTDGEVLIGDTNLQVLQGARKKFGRGKFMMCRIGEPLRWRGGSMTKVGE